MSWTQGIITREEMSADVIEKLERGYTVKTGEVDRIEYVTWFEPDRSDLIAHFESGRGFKVGKPK